MNLTETERALVWLSACSKLESREISRLLLIAESYEQLYAKFEKFSDEVIKNRRNGVYKKGTFSERERELDEYLRELERRDFFVVTKESRDYPVPLSSIGQPPLVLYGAGKRELLQEEIFCIVGSRKTLPWAEKLGSLFAEKLSERFAIVTGLAEGGDLAALRGALPSGKAICVLPCGLDKCYPASHASYKEQVMQKGLLITECPLGENTRKYSFHLRNRILAGLSKGVLVLSAGEKSGALITAHHAVDCGREVFAFPYSLGVSQGEGCNQLIKKGAYLCTCVEDIFYEFGIFTAQKQEKPALSEEECKILNILLEGEALHAAVIAERTHLQVFETNAYLSSLELKGLVVRAGGNRFSVLKS